MVHASIFSETETDSVTIGEIHTKQTETLAFSRLGEAHIVANVWIHSLLLSNPATLKQTLLNHATPNRTELVATWGFACPQFHFESCPPRYPIPRIMHHHHVLLAALSLLKHKTKSSFQLEPAGVKLQVFICTEFT